MATTNSLQYKVMLVTFSGHTYVYSGAQSLEGSTPAAISAACTAMATDIANQMNNGTATITPVATRLAVDMASS